MPSFSHRASEADRWGRPITGDIPPMPKQYRRKNRLDEADLYYADTTYEPPSPDYFDFGKHAGED